MTIRRLAEANSFTAGQADATQSRTAVAFAFDAGYLAPFRVMIHSMLRSGSLVDSPVYIYSDDPLVFDDPLVEAIADRSILVEGADLDELSTVAEDHIKRPERAKWNRGTCLKWMVFDDAPVDQILFLDVDMLCLRPINGFLHLFPNADLVTCAQFQRAMMPDPELPDSKAEARERLVELLELRSTHARRINSGVMLVRKKLLSRAFRDELIKYATSRLDINEQAHLTAYFNHRGGSAGVSRAIASSSYNFQENYLELTDAVDALMLLRRIRILHYAGSTKPWQPKAASNPRYSLQLWRQFELSADDAEQRRI